MEKMSDQARTRWAAMGGKLGMLFAGIGFLLMILGWNGAAGLDYVQGQIPYLLSGGMIGLGFVIFGAVLLIIESNRRDRMLVERRLEELAAAMSRVAAVEGNGAAPATPPAPEAPKRRTRPMRAARH